MQPLRDLDSMRNFLSGLGPTALFDLPWIPVYIGVIFAFHPLLGTVALCGALILVAITLMTEGLTRSPIKAALTDNVERHGLAETGRRNAEVLVAMGMTERMADRWETANAAYLETQNKVADVAGGFGAISKVLRVMLQSAVLGVGAYLVIYQEATAGNHYCGIDPDRARFRPGRPCYRQLEGICRCAPEPPKARDAS